MVLSGLLMGSCVLCVLDKLAGQTTGGWTLTDWSRQGTLSIMWSIHREAAVQLISLDKEKQTLVQCWRAHYYYLFILFIYEIAIFINHILIYSCI